MSNKPKSSYYEVLKSSALIGASSVLDIACRVVRTKAMALLLGPAGIGLLGLYTSITELARSIASLGVSSSAVRQIAEANATGDPHRVARTVTSLKYLSLATAILGFLFLLIGSKWVSRLTFEDETRTSAVALLSLVVLFGVISAAQAALIQGVRRISDLARINVLGAFWGTLFSVPIVWLFGEKGLVPALVCVGVMGLFTSWWYVRKIKIDLVRLSFAQFWSESSALLKLGFAFMASSFMMIGSGYVVRLLVLRDLGVDAAGYYQAAWSLSGIYASFILGSMAADFYPRLTAAANDHEECNRLVNEQAEIGFLLACPGVMATLAFAPLVIQIFYSGKFTPAVDILRWICLGILLRVVVWPMGFIVLAKGAQKIFFWTEVLSNVLLLGLTWSALKLFGLNGTGIGFFVMYIFYCVWTYLIVRKMSGFRWSSANRRLVAVFFPVVAGIFLSWYVLPHVVAEVLSATATILSGWYSVKVLCTLVPLSRFPQPIPKVLRFLRLAPKDAFESPPPAEEVCSS